MWLVSILFQEERRSSVLPRSSPNLGRGEVINGFYMNMRSKFTAPGTSIYYYEALRMPLHAIVMLPEFWIAGVRTCNHITQNISNAEYPIYILTVW